ncbi:MAG: hypothetical protein AAFU54_07085 [Chloroflexota bacterium]
MNDNDLYLQILLSRYRRHEMERRAEHRRILARYVRWIRKGSAPDSSAE